MSSLIPSCCLVWAPLSVKVPDREVPFFPAGVGRCYGPPGGFARWSGQYVLLGACPLLSFGHKQDPKTGVSLEYGATTALAPEVKGMFSIPCCLGAKMSLGQTHPRTSVPTWSGQVHEIWEQELWENLNSSPDSYFYWQVP